MRKFDLETIRDRFNVLSLDKLELNEGQLDGVPENPRDCTEEKFEELKKSITEDAEFMEYKTLFVYALNNGKYIIIGGNMRCLAMRALGFEEAPCIEIPQDTSVEKLRKLAIIDNTNFGKWNWDMLANEWDAKNLSEWGVDLPMMESEINPDEFFNEAENQSEKEKGEKLTISLPEDLNDQKEEIKAAVEDALSSYSGIKVK